jgi:asparagine synthetase B (glutamine-hydrolysing)
VAQGFGPLPLLKDKRTMNFIARASSQGCLKLISPANDEFGFRISESEDKNSYTLSSESGHVLSATAGKLAMSIFCEHQVFIYRESADSFLVSSSLELILSNAEGKISPSLDYFIEYVSCGATPRVSTPFLGVLYLPPGSEIDYTTMHINLGKEHDVECPQFLDVLGNRLRKVITGDQRIALEYSGGLESSILLHSLLDITGGKNLRLVHLTDFSSGQVDDLKRVRILAAKYNCDLTILDMEDLKPFQIGNRATVKPNFPHPGLVNIGYINQSSGFLAAKGSMIFNGAGGDSIFCASPQKGLPVELLKKWDVVGSIRNVCDISNYLRSPFMSTVVEAVREFRDMESKLNNPGIHFAEVNHNKEILNSDCLGRDYKFGVPVLPNCKELSGRERHLNAAINRYEMRSSPMASFASQYVYPFLAPDVLSAGLMTPSNKLLKGKIDRYSVRKSAADRFNVDEFWYRRKGGVAGLTQRCFSRYKSDLKGFVSDGYLVRSKVVDVDNVCHLIDQVAAGVVKCPGSLINLVTANIYMLHWRENVHEF